MTAPYSVITHALERERKTRGFASLLVLLLVASYAVWLLRPAVAGESDEFRGVAAAAPSNVPDTDTVCNALTAAAQENDLPTDFFTRLIWQESRFDPMAVSRAGAQGVAQFMPDTATWRGLSDPFDPFEAIPKSANSCANCAANSEISGSPQLPTMPGLAGCATGSPAGADCLGRRGLTCAS